jgi:hypothetical protein
MNGQFDMDFTMDYNIQKTTCKIMNMNFYLQYVCANTYLNLYCHSLNIFKHIDWRLIVKDINLTIKMDFIMYDKFAINWNAIWFNAQSFNVSEFAFQQMFLGELECFIVNF